MAVAAVGLWHLWDAAGYISTAYFLSFDWESGRGFATFLICCEVFAALLVGAAWLATSMKANGSFDGPRRIGSFLLLAAMAIPGVLIFGFVMWLVGASTLVKAVAHADAGAAKNFMWSALRLTAGGWVTAAAWLLQPFAMQRIKARA